MTKIAIELAAGSKINKMTTDTADVVAYIQTEGVDRAEIAQISQDLEAIREFEAKHAITSDKLAELERADAAAAANESAA